MRLPDEIFHFCEKALGAVTSATPVSGGCINNGAKLNTITGTYFIKWNSATQFPDMFTREQHGLNLLQEAKALRIPKVMHVYEGEQHSCLVTEWITTGPPAADFWKNFGEGLADLHKNSGDSYGLEVNNYMGSLPQENTPTSLWTDFFTTRRILPQAKLALDSGGLDKNEYERIRALTERFPELLYTEDPSLTHGDLWSGNFMIDDNGQAVLIDPAVGYCHRETDLAMTRLFGGFDNTFYESYRASFPLEPNWQERLDIYTLYPLLIHVNLFGGGYARQVMQIVNRYF